MQILVCCSFENDLLIILVIPLVENAVTMKVAFLKLPEFFMPLGWKITIDPVFGFESRFNKLLVTFAL